MTTAAIHSYKARDIRVHDIVTLTDDTTHNGEVMAVQAPTTQDRNIVIDCVTCGTPEQPHPELHKRSAGALVTAVRIPKRVKA